MLSHMFGDILKFVALYLEFYIPFGEDFYLHLHDLAFHEWNLNFLAGFSFMCSFGTNYNPFLTLQLVPSGCSSGEKNPLKNIKVVQMLVTIQSQ